MNQQSPNCSQANEDAAIGLKNYHGSKAPACLNIAIKLAILLCLSLHAVSLLARFGCHTSLGAEDDAAKIEVTELAQEYMLQLISSPIDPVFSDVVSYWDKPTHQWVVAGKIDVARQHPLINPATDGVVLTRLFPKPWKPDPFTAILYEAEKGTWKLRFANVSHFGKYTTIERPADQVLPVFATHNEEIDYLRGDVLVRAANSWSGAPVDTREGMIYVKSKAKK